MKPNEVSPTSANIPPPDGQPDSNSHVQESQRQATVDLVRSQIDNLYGAPDKSDLTTAQQFEAASPYDRTHADNPQPDLEQWKQYHSAWQTYYQKYYEGYYAHHLGKTKQTAHQQPRTHQTHQYFSSQPEEKDEEPTSKDQALFDLRQKLLSKVQSSAKKVRKSRHFVPIASAIIVILIFAFLQYNRVIISNVMAYVSPGSIDPQNIVIDPSTDINVGPESRLIIPKINVDVPVIYDVGNDSASQLKAMESGLAQFAIPGASSHPGQVGNTVLSGHSSNDLLDRGDYKFIFAQLDKLAVGDSIYAHYGSKRYTYSVTEKIIVQPSEVNRLVYPTTKPILTLITCTPLGTALNRLLVIADQVSPDPAGSVAAPVVNTDDSATMPGNSPTFFERLFGQGN